MNDMLSYDLQVIQREYAAEFEKQLLTYRTPFTIVLIIIYTFAFVVGLIGNSMVIMVMVKHRHLRTVTNMFLVNLSVGDLLVVIVCMPFSLAPYVYKVSAESVCYINLKRLNTDVLCFYKDRKGSNWLTF